MTRSLLTTALLASCVAVAQGQNDRVRTRSSTITGEVVKTTPLVITVKRGSQEIETPISEVRTVVYGGEPAELTQARVNAENGAYAKALEKLESLDADAYENPLVGQDIVYYSAMCRARLALLGEGRIRDAGRMLGTFLSQNSQSRHRLAGAELLGDLYAAAGAYPNAEKEYQRLARAPWPSYKMRAGVLVARALQAQGKHTQAVARFDEVLTTPGDDPAGKQQKLAATLGKAVSLAATGDTQQGVGLVEGVIRDADPDQEELLAIAYNTLGAAYVEAGKSKDALFAFLHVDLLFPTQAAARAEALYYLGSLWEEVGNTAEAREARRVLKQEYGSTSWAKK